MNHFHFLFHSYPSWHMTGFIVNGSVLCSYMQVARFRCRIKSVPDQGIKPYFFGKQPVLPAIFQPASRMAGNRVCEFFIPSFSFIFILPVEHQKTSFDGFHFQYVRCNIRTHFQCSPSDTYSSSINASRILDTCHQIIIRIPERMSFLPL